MRQFPEPWPYAEGATGLLPIIPGQTFTGREAILRPLPIPVVMLSGLGREGVEAVRTGGWDGTGQNSEALAWKVNPNQSAVDLFTLYHLGLGALLRQLGLGLGAALAISVAWEWWLEPAWKVRRPDLFPVPGQDSGINRLTDTLAVGAGWWLAGRLGAAQ